MQYRPDTKELLSAIQEFMMKELLPKLEGDDLLSYKTLVSWNMLGVIAREIENSEYTNLWAEILNQKFLISDLESKYNLENFQKLTKREKHQIIYNWNQSLAQTIRNQSNQTNSKHNSPNIDTSPKGKIWNLVKLQLKENLSVSNPRFQV
ncbi:hypothetical protein EHQ96_06030 [Leptospira levettii]|uniref:hypothetical protein n=1 Tax=Leptospira levettii TaxID=2023178 RepID=UPI000C29B28E|nr:hypothetical protein [Leptospira levettii]MCW7474411.1 hypothetical protein [Leptospira levettii]PJZ38746.1 hypothetical protein CH354_06015 [Leptospira levettii]PJZ90492.1 hypothetical protein CH368_01055 [Leptospira levettii]PKA02050.1 hypothetical protein CH369_02435 [Leptospira levettii]TGM69101.1 hypothetical protein EHQ96_06030 [Leptospira levettii]